MITRVSDEERDALVAEVMRLMLFSQYRDGAPVPRADISKLVSSHSQARGLTSWIIAQAQVRFMGIFGYEMKELSKTAARKTGAARAAALDAEPPKVYVLKSALPASARQRWVDRSADHAKRGFCMTVCALVHMSGGTLPEDRLWQHLEAMGVRRDDAAHPKLGDARAALARLVKKRYLIREKLHGATDAAGGDARTASRWRSARGTRSAWTAWRSSSRGSCAARRTRRTRTPGTPGKSRATPKTRSTREANSFVKNWYFRSSTRRARDTYRVIRHTTDARVV